MQAGGYIDSSIWYLNEYPDILLHVDYFQEWGSFYPMYLNAVNSLHVACLRPNSHDTCLLDIYVYVNNYHPTFTIYVFKDIAIKYGISIYL